MPEGLTLLDAIYTTRAIRKFQPEPVPLELVARVIEAATMAPSGRNTQPWRFIVIDRTELKDRIGELYREGYYGSRPGWDQRDENEDPSIYLANHLQEAPVIILACGRLIERTSDRQMTLPIYGAVYPAVQNLLLAATALGLGSALTTIAANIPDQVRELTDLPEHVRPMALIPLGWPARALGPPRRRPVTEIAHRDRYGRPW